MGQYTIAVLAGDGIGPEVTAEAVRVLRAVAARFGHSLTFEEALVGQAAIAAEGTTVSDATLELCQRGDAVLFGAAGTLDRPLPPGAQKPVSAILRLRKALGLFANLRPVRVVPALAGASPLRAERLSGVDLLIVRELTGGLYYGEPGGISETATGARAVDTMAYAEDEIKRVVNLAFELARGRRRHVTSVDKANVLHCSRLWRRVTTRVSAQYPDVELRHLLVDACAIELIRQPASFDVIVTENLFGDILSDEASMLLGSVGMLPSASLGSRRTAHGVFGLYEPAHGSAPDIAGKGIANPLGAILSAALLLRYSLGLEDEARAIENAVADALASGPVTPDLALDKSAIGTTHEVGGAVAAHIA